MKTFCSILILITVAIMASAEVPAGVFRRGMSLAPTEIDPTKFDDAWSIQIATQIYRRLFKINQNGKLVLDLADSYAVDSSFKTHRVCLKSQEKFSDGSNIEIKDVAFSIARAASPNINKLTSYYFSRIKGFNRCGVKKEAGQFLCKSLSIRIVSDKCIEIVTDESTPTLPSLLSTTSASILKVEKIPHLAQLEQNIYSGNYIIKSNSTEKIVLEKNPFHPLNGISKIEYYFEDAETSLKKYSAGQRSFASIPSKSEFNELPEEQKKKTYSRITATNYFFILPELEIEIRREIAALLCGFAGSGVIDSIYGITAQQSDTVFPSRLFFNPMIESSLKTCHQSQTSFNHIQKIHQTILIPDVLAGSSKLKLSLEEWLKTKAPNIKVRIAPFNDVFAQYLTGKRVDILLLGFMPAYLDLEYYVREWFSDKSSVALVKNNKTAAALAESFSQTKNRLYRYKLARQMLGILQAEFITVPFYEEAATYLVSPSFYNFSFSHFGEYGLNMDDITLSSYTMERGE